MSRPRPPPVRASRYLSVFLLAASIICELSAADNFPTPGTRKMAARLDQIAREADPEKNPFLNAQRAELYGLKLARRLGRPDENISLLSEARGAYGLELLLAGRSLEAITQFQKLLDLQQNGAVFQGRRDLTTARIYLALAHLRLGEQENCLSNHTTLSCIAPIHPSAAHKFPRGSQGAIRVLREELRANPENLEARWLLNLACMTLGEYPQNVPAQFLVPPEAFKSEYDIHPFSDVAAGAGLDVDSLAGGSITEDFDGDGLLDVMASSMGLRDQLRYFQNNGDGTFAERTREAGLIGEVGGLNIQQTDYNNDGFADVFVLRGGWFGREGDHPKSLLRNRGDGTFDDVTEEAGLLSLMPTQTAAWFDYDGDGWLDVFIGHESHGGDANPCQLFHNNRNGTFTDRSRETGLAIIGRVKGVAAGDYNNDGRPDLYISRLGESNLLLRNDGAGADGTWRFTDLTAAAGVAEPLYSFPTWFFDFNNDGWEDIFVSGFRVSSVGDIAADYLGRPHSGALPRLYRNNGDGTFADATSDAGLDTLLLGMGANYGDLDNDGWLDFYVGTGEPSLAMLVPNRMFRNDRGRKFQDVTTSGGFGHLQKGHGISFADLDNDGDQDVYEVIGGAFSGDNYRNVLFENPGHGNNWLKLKLEGTRANRAAIGARLKIFLNSGNQERTIHRTVSTGGSFGASPLRQEIGVGRASRIKRLEILWPGSGHLHVLTNLPINTVVLVREGEPDYRVKHLPPFTFHRGHAGHH